MHAPRTAEIGCEQKNPEGPRTTQKGSDTHLHAQLQQLRLERIDERRLVECDGRHLLRLRVQLLQPRLRSAVVRTRREVEDQR